MKRSTMRFLLTALMILTVLLGFTACGLFGGDDTDSYTVKIMDGETIVKELSFDKGATFSYNKADLAKPGYDLAGLYTDAALSAAYTADVLSGDLTLYAKYAPKDFYIFIDYNADGDTEDLEVKATYGATYTIADPAERQGYRFAGYERKVNKVWQSFPATGTFNFTEDIEIRVVWEKINYVTVLGRDGAQVGKYEIAVDGTVTLPAVADTATHTFGGYVVDGQPYGEKQADGTYKVTGATASVTATQKWTAIPTYLLTVNGLYGTDAVAPATYKTGDTFTLPAAPTNGDKIFAGYTVNGEALNATNGVYTFTWSANTVVTANWIDRIYITVQDEYSNAILGKVEVIDGAYDLSAFVPTGSDAAFTEGNVDYTYAGFIYNGTAFAATGTYTGGSITVIRDWDGVDKIYLNVISVGAAYNFQAQEAIGGAYTLAAPSLDTHYFVGFFSDADCTQAFATEGTLSATTTVYAKWHRKATITVYDGATVLQTLTVPQNGAYTLNIPGNTATHTFGGFVCNGAAFAATGTYTGEADLTVMVSWTAIPSFDVFLNANEGAFASGQGGKQTVYQGGSVILPVPTREGYLFGGWYAAGVQYGAFDGEDYVLSYADWNKDADLTLSAKWTAVRTEGEQFNGQTSLNYFLKLNGDKYTYILLTGHSYTFGAAGSTITLGEGADAYVSLNGANGIKVGSTKGAFSMTISTPATETAPAQSITVDVIVKHYVSGIGATGDLAATTGSAYLNNFYGHATGAITAKKPLAVGLENFKPEIAITSVGGSKLSLADLKEDYTLTATMNGADITNLIEINAAGDAISFHDTLLWGSNAGDEVLVTLTFTPKYALKADGIKPFSMTVSLNDGVNVYTNKELFDAFEDLNVKTINVLRNIKAEIDVKHGYNGNVNDPHNGYEHGVYYRVATVADRLTVNGNYFKIDGSDLPLMAPYDSTRPGSLAFGDGGYCNRVPYHIIDVQFGIFSYFNNSSENLGQQKLTLNDLYVVGNCQWSNLNNDALTVGDAKILKYSGSYPGMVFRRTQGEINNCVVTNTNIAYYTTGHTESDGYTPTTLISAITLNNSKGEKNWGNSIYAYGQSHVTLNNSFFGASGGPSIHFDDHATTTDDVNLTSKLAVSTDTVFDNYRTGSEGWFVGWNLAGSASLVKGMFNPLNTDPNTNAFLKLKYGRLQAIEGVREATKQGYIAAGAPTEMAQAEADKAAAQVAALPYTTIPENAKALRQSAAGEEFNFILITKACGGGWNTEDAHRKVHVNLSRIENGVETPVAPNAMNAATQGLFPNYYACYDSKLYMDYEITGFGTVGFILGLYE